MFKKLIESEHITSVGQSESGILDLSEFGGSDVEAMVDVTAMTGTSPTLTVIPYYSYNGVVWKPIPSAFRFSQFTTTGDQTIKLPFTGVMVKFVYDVGGTSPNITFSLYARAAVGGSASSISASTSGGGEPSSSPTQNKAATSKTITLFEVQDGASEACAANPDRNYARVVNTSPYPIYAGDDDSVTPASGFPIQPTEDYIHDAKDELFLVTDTGNEADIFIIDYLN